MGMKEHHESVYQISLVPGPIWQWFGLLICSLFIAVFLFSLVKFLSERLENSKENWCPKFIQFLEEHRLVGSTVLRIPKLSAVAAELNCHPLKFKFILFCQESFLLYPPYGWSLLQDLSYNFVFPVTPSHCFHFLSIVKHKRILNTPFMALKHLIPFQLAVENTSPLTLKQHIILQMHVIHICTTEG